MDSVMKAMSAVWSATTGTDAEGVNCFTGTIVGSFIELRQFTD
ncbi:MAG: hypothetical protein QF793_03245 [Candidatus Peribacteraceae bacterium]|nr:hypothetical protein [Candidatus Peribacteraceae bacterium]